MKKNCWKFLGVFLALILGTMPVMVFGEEEFDGDIVREQGMSILGTGTPGTPGTSMENAPLITCASDISQSSVDANKSSWTIETEKKEFWLKFKTAHEKSFYWISVKNYNISGYYSAWGSLWTGILSEDQNELWSSYNNENNSSSTFLNLSPDTVYYIKMVGATGNMGICVAQNQDDIEDEKGDASEFNLETENNYGVQGYDDIDWFKMITTDNDSFYRFTVRNNSVASSDLKVKVYSGADEEVISFEPWENNQTITYKKLKKNTQYYIKAYSINSSIGKYSFKVEEIIDDVPDEKENSILISPGTTVVKKINAPGDKDWFKFSVSDSRYYTVKTKSYMGGDTHFYVYDVNERSLMHEYLYENYDRSNNISFEGGKEYYIRVSNEDSMGTYEFSVSSSNESDDPNNESNDEEEGKTSFTITSSSGDGGTITPNGSIRVNEGNSKTFTIKPDNGYQIYQVYVDGESVGSVSKYTFDNVKASHTIHAMFIGRDYVTDRISAGSDEYSVVYKNTVSFNGKKHYQKGRGSETSKKIYDVDINVLRNGNELALSEYKVTFKKNKKAGEGFFKIKLKGKQYKSVNKAIKKQKYMFSIR